jgi:hypothetical protein
MLPVWLNAACNAFRRIDFTPQPEILISWRYCLAGYGLLGTLVGFTGFDS